MTAKCVLLIQADGKIPNLALMKLATHHKARGDEVSLVKGIKISSRLVVPDIVYISCIFSENRDAALHMARQFPRSQVYIGGSGVDLKTELSAEIEHLKPDYDLFDCDYSIGFTSRGCIRKCPFCIVPEKEGHIKAVADIYEFWDPRHKHIVLCDNNILALPEHFRYIADQISDENLTVDFNQGLDIRLLTSENVDILASLRIKPNLRFSWDNTKSESAVLRGIQLLRDAGIKRSQFFVLSGFDSTFEDDLYRLNRLKQEGQRAYLMRYNTVRGKREYNDLAAWANQPAFFSKMTFQEFQTARANA
jgi:hypothetical protein